MRVSRRMWARLLKSMEDWEPEVEFWIGCTYERNWLRIKEWDVVFQNYRCKEMDRAIGHRHWCTDLSNRMSSSWYRIGNCGVLHQPPSKSFHPSWFHVVKIALNNMLHVS
jgi:hypothetical protein